MNYMSIISTGAQKSRHCSHRSRGSRHCSRGVFYYSLYNDVCQRYYDDDDDVRSLSLEADELLVEAIGTGK